MNEEYIKRINKVLIYIENHMDQPLSLQTMADIACYSPFHLHRIFKAITNEPLNAYIVRKRVEKSALLLIHNKEYSIAEIAFKYGFQSNVTFSRTFKKIFGLSPAAFRNANQHNFSKIGKVNSKSGKLSFITEEYLRNINHLKNWITMNANITIKEMPNRNLAYVTQIGEKGLELSFQKIIIWAQSQGLLQQPDNHICRVFHDSFKVTDANKVRMSIGVVSHRAMPAGNEIHATTLEIGKVIVGSFEIVIDDFEKAWNSMFIWMNENGYKKSDHFPFELYYNNYMDHPEKKCIVDICIPVL